MQQIFPSSYNVRPTDFAKIAFLIILGQSIFGEGPFNCCILLTSHFLPIFKFLLTSSIPIELSSFDKCISYFPTLKITDNGEYASYAGVAASSPTEKEQELVRFSLFHKSPPIFMIHIISHKFIDVKNNLYLTKKFSILDFRPLQLNFKDGGHHKCITNSEPQCGTREPGTQTCMNYRTEVRLRAYTIRQSVYTR